jgi:hypothetical protein
MKYILIILLLASCSRQVQEQPIVKRAGGLQPDNVKAVEKVPLIVSRGFVAYDEPEINMQFIARGKQDRQAPTITSYSPANGTNVSGLVGISFYAKDNTGVVEAAILINGTKVSNGYSYEWNTKDYSAGLHQITFNAKDAAGNIRSLSVTVTVNTIIIEPPVDTVVTTGPIAMPPVGNQGPEGSCVAFAVGYAARSVDWYYRTGATSYNNAVNIFSPEFLYNQVKFSDDCAVGTAMQTALDLMVNSGICTFQSMPYNSNDCATQPNDQQRTEASNYRIGGYYKIYTTDKAAIRAMIDLKKLVIISIVADNSFMQAKAGFIWKAYSGSGSLGHSVVICGYDDSKNAWKIMNSWGNLWADAGYSWIDYDFFPTRTGTYCYAIN